MADYGLLVLRLPDGRNLRVRGSVSEKPTGFTAEAIVNHDGSFDRSLTRRGYQFELSLAARDQAGALIDFEALFRLAPSSISLLSEGERATRTYSRAQFVGEPAFDLQTGEVTGVMVQAESRLVSDD